MTSGEYGEFFFRCRGFRTVGQLALEGLVAFILFWAWIGVLAVQLLAVPMP